MKTTFFIDYVDRRGYDRRYVLEDVHEYNEAMKMAEELTRTTLRGGLFYKLVMLDGWELIVIKEWW